MTCQQLCASIDGLGFTVVSTSPRLGDDSFHWVWLRLGKADVMLNTAYEFEHERPSVPNRARVAAHGDTGLFLECPNLDGAYASLCAAGLTPSAPQVTGYGMRQMSLCDPDGYALCFQWSAAG